VNLRLVENACVKSGISYTLLLIKIVYMSLASFRGQGKVKSIGNPVVFDNGITLLNIEVEMQHSDQILPFYLVDNENRPRTFNMIRKHFGKYGAFEIDEEIQFDYNIIIKDKDKGLCKMKIWSIYNRVMKNVERQDTETS